MKESEDRYARIESACQRKIRANQEFMDRYLTSQIEVEQKASLDVDEVKHLKDLLSFTQESMLQAEEVKSSYERKIKDLEHHALTVESLSK